MGGTSSRLAGTCCVYTLEGCGRFSLTSQRDPPFKCAFQPDRMLQDVEHQLPLLVLRDIWRGQSPPRQRFYLARPLEMAFE